MTDISIVEVSGALADWGEFTLSGAGVSEVGRYCTADMASSSNIGLDYPIPVPDSGYNNSFWKTHYLKAGGTFDDEEINTIRLHTDGTLGWTGCNIWIAKSGNLSSVGYGVPSSQHDQATGTVGTSGDDFWTDGGHSFYSGATAPSANLFDFTDADKFYVMSGDAASEKITSKGYSKGWVTQARVSGNATHGVKPDKTFTVTYNII